MKCAIFHMLKYKAGLTSGDFNAPRRFSVPAQKVLLKLQRLSHSWPRAQENSWGLTDQTETGSKPLPLSQNQVGTSVPPSQASIRGKGFEDEGIAPT